MTLKIITPSLIAIIHFLITAVLKIDRYFFDYSCLDTGHYYFIKILYFICLFIFWNFIFFVYKKIKEKNIVYKRGLKLFLIYFVIMTILILLVYPGLWSWDDIYVLKSDICSHYSGWQHILSGFEHMIALEFLPFTGGIIIIRNFIISCCVSFIIIKIENNYSLKLNNKILDYFLKIIPFLMFPLLRYQLSGYRMGLCVYFEMVVLCILICALKEKTKWSILYSVSFILLSIISITWRSENFVYLPMIFILLMLLKNIGSIQKRLIIISAIIIGVLIINSKQELYLGTKDYEIMSTLRQATVLVRFTDPKKDEKELNDINKVLKIETIKNNKANGEALYWIYNVVRDDYSKLEYQKYLNALISLAIKYPKIVLGERINLFLDTSGIRGQRNGSNLYLINILSDNKNNSEVSLFFKELGKKCILNKPINKELKKQTANLICLERNDFLYKIVWNIIPPIIAILIWGITMLLKRRWKEFLIFTVIIAKMVLIFLTAPSIYIMYYLSFYLMGYIIIFYSSIKYIAQAWHFCYMIFLRKKGKKNDKYINRRFTNSI